MSPESLYDLVQNLDESQISAFRKWVNANTRKTKKEPKFLILFKRLREGDFYDEKAVRKKHFLNPSDFYKSRDLLLRKLVECFSTSESSDRHNLSMIYTALEFGALELAEKYFQDEMKRFATSIDAHRLLEMSRIREVVLKDFRVDIATGTNCLSLQQALRLASIELEAMGLIDDSRKAFGDTQDIKEGLRNRITAFVNAQDFTPLLEGYFHFKLLVADAILAGADQRAAYYQLELADSLLSGKVSVRKMEMIREISNAVTFALRSGNKEKSAYYIMQLSNLQVSNDTQKNLKMERWIRRTIEAGFVFGDEKILDNGVQRFWSNQTLFSTLNLARYPLLAAFAHLLLGNIGPSHQLIRQAQTLSRKVTRHLPWQLDILDLILHLEKENFDYVEEILDSKKRKFRGQAYPTFILKGIGTVLEMGGVPNQLYVERIKKEQAILALSQEIQREMKHFNFEVYLEAKVRNCPLRLILEERSGKKALSLAM